ncbi:MAG: outer membrane beta-barrel protein [Hyphomicrobium sp.]|uniref:outer membrane protein n=1 Tax=Hyphomicrobium sp. TaxID=82 RepID=UPI00132645CC|nr:outer membrane beta-barrel protein [Hyphomicrobium sp.]KAB2941263.1 MAG: porin family protein [Hyphomicrobium sp.]MBZ0209153.1 outer membrane beta-barrel protein [Hyphomicrobium sp.]
MRQIYLAAASLAAAAVTLAVTPAQAQVTNPWNGLYVGVNGGYAWQDVGGTYDSSATVTNLTGSDLNGAVVGGQIGYNWQSAQLLLGVEFDAMTLADGGENINVASTPAAVVGTDMNYLASVRARLGWAINNWLLFGSIGWGFSEFEFTQNVPSTGFSSKLRLDDNGLAYGGGVEVMMSYGVSLRAEYLRYDLGASSPVSGGPVADTGDRVAFDNIDVARAALSIKLSQ